jgi:hypothetical protein
MKTVFSALLAMVLLLAVPGPTTEAKITPEACVNGGGNYAAGQQPDCIGSGQTELPAMNPAGHAPPGQNS